jgi:hypothetical protein
MIDVHSAERIIVRVIIEVPTFLHLVPAPEPRRIDLLMDGVVIHGMQVDKGDTFIGIDMCRGLVVRCAVPDFLPREGNFHLPDIKRGVADIIDEFFANLEDGIGRGKEESMRRPDMAGLSTI